MKITEVRSTVFLHPSRIARDSEGHGHPGEERMVRAGILEIVAEDGTIGRALAGPGDVAEELVAAHLRPVLVGADPLRREMLWQRMYKRQRGSGQRFTDRVLCAADLALWDLAGRLLGVPVWKLAGGYRDRIPAYASTMCGDDLEGGLRTPEDYGRFAEWAVKTRGYRAVKLHTWMPPIPGAPDVRRDAAACAAVRKAVGPDVPLMLDPSHWYSRQDSVWLGRRLEELGFLWMEESMEEASISSYRWLSDQLSLNILGPESMSGKHWTRAEWIAAGACDMIRCGVWGVGGLTPALKIAALAESFHMSCEVHGTGAGNLALCGAIPNTTFYERGLLHPFLDYDAVPPHLRRLDDTMDAEGIVHMPQEPGLGHDLDLEWIAAHRVEGA